MPTITNNRTRYSTDDLLAVLTWFEEAVAAKTGNLWIPPEGIVVRTISPSQIENASGVKFWKKNNGYYRGSSTTPAIWETKDGAALKIVSPRHLPDDDDPSRVAVHAWKDERPPMPLSVLREILIWYWSCGKMDHASIRAHHEEVMKWISVAGREIPPVYVDEKVHNPVKSVKPTREGKINRVSEMHGDPNRPMQGSAKTPSGHWSNALYWAGTYYQREWDRREKWRLKAVELGEKRKQHQTWAEYLIYAGKYLKKHGRMP